ncbi:MAG: dimethylsulfonioproprionate lyase family protein [Pseudomonadota bacterium]
MRTGHADARRLLANRPPPEPARRPVPNDLPVTAWLPVAADNAPDDMVNLVRLLAGLAGRFSWQQTYTAADLGHAFLDKYGWSLLVGPGAPVECKTLLVGVMLLGPDLEYPVHRHSAEEVYLVLSGRASWQIAGSGWEIRTPGHVIHNPPWQPHGVRTDQGQPLLLGFVWNAGAPEKSRFTELHSAGDATS